MTIKVLHLIDSGGLYGAEMMLLNLVEEQLRIGMKPLIISAGVPDQKEKAIEVEAKNRKLPVKTIRMSAGFNIAKAFEVILFAKQECFDVLHSHGYKFDILLGVLPRVLRKLPIVTTVHGYIPAKPFSKLAVYQWLDRTLIKSFDDVIFVNKYMLDQMYFKNTKFKNISVINNGINVDRETAKLNLQREYEPNNAVTSFMDDASVLIGTISRLSEGKGVQELITAFKDVIVKYPTAKLLVVGDGYYREALEDLVDKYNLVGSVMFVGYCDKTYFYLAKFDMFVLPSHSEGLPMVLLEAMIAEKLIISTNVGGVPEVLGGGNYGFLVKPKAAKELANLLIQICDELQAGKSSIDKNKLLIDEVKQNYSSKMMAESYADVYRSLIVID